MDIRFLNNDDVLQYKKLRLSSLIESPFAFCDSYEDYLSKSLLDYQLEIIKVGSPLECFTIGAFSNENHLIGFVKFRRDARIKARHRATLNSLYIAPNYRGKGIAKMLLLKLFEIIELIPGIEQLQLSTIITRSSLIEFYQKLGFNFLGGIIEKDLIIENEYQDSLYMVKYF